jgi:diacylglycerol kinase family enzyme
MPEMLDIFINRKSGTVLREGEDVVCDALRETLGSRIGVLTFIDPHDLAAIIRKWADQNQNNARGLIVGGGDGTALTAATEILGRDDITLGVLPLGTHNLFASQLGFETDFRKAAIQYSKVCIANIDVGVVNEYYFLCGILVDHQSTGYYVAREYLRDGKIFIALKLLLQLLCKILLFAPQKMLVAGQVVSGHAIAVTNNLYAPKPSKFSITNASAIKKIIENALAKAESEELLGVYALRAGFWRVLSLMNAFIKGTWTQSPHVTVLSAKSFSISHLPADNKDAVIAVDGEIKKTTYPLNISLLPKGLKVFRPFSSSVALPSSTSQPSVFVCIVNITYVIFLL